ncbi:MAG: hypothetical protein CBCREVIR_2820 [Candidatus Burkholderia crenata]|nr:MAG: hypothetical protein CBCREVIR_2820 [Candidatus Burkholderia crenata]
MRNIRSERAGLSRNQQQSARFSHVARNSALASRIAFVAPSRCCRQNRARVFIAAAGTHYWAALIPHYP